MNKTCIIIAGPTASGKTAIALKLAQHFKTRIISADSRQCYRELDIGVAKPTPEELATIHHYFVNTHNVNEEVNAAVFEKYALQCAEEIFAANAVAVITGGTGLYLKAFCEGLDAIPEIDPIIRQEVIAGYNESGLGWLQNQVEKKDPLFFAGGEMQNPHRLMRALEVMLSTGKSILQFQNNQKINRPFNIIKFGLEWPRPILYDRINKRVGQMIDHGLLEEVNNLMPLNHLKALQTVGYQELFEYFGGAINLEEAIAKIKQNTRRYAKRQMTWFKKDQEVQWVDAQDTEAALAKILQSILRA